MSILTNQSVINQTELQKKISKKNIFNSIFKTIITDINHDDQKLLENSKEKNK